MKMSREACEYLGKEDRRGTRNKTCTSLFFIFYFLRSFLHMPQGHLARLFAVVVIKVMYRL